MTIIGKSKPARGRRKILFLAAFSLSFLFSPRADAQQQSGKNFTARLMNIEAAANAPFTYNATLHNSARVARVFDLSAQIPIGWVASFKVDGSQVTSLNLDSNATQNISIEINPPATAAPSKYKIPVQAIAGADTATLHLEAVVKGTYGLQLTTPTGKLSDNVTEGDHKEIHLQLKNTGTITLDNVDISAQAPPQWETSFSPAKIDHLEPGKAIDVTATLHVPDKTLAGDYVTTFSAKNPGASSDAAFRITVKVSALSGWLGFLVILIALGIVYFLVRKYGRR